MNDKNSSAILGVRGFVILQYRKARKGIIFLAAGHIFFPGIILLLLSGCGKGSESSQLGTITPEASVEQSTQSNGSFDEQARRKDLDEALVASDKAYEAREHGAPMPPSQFRFPNETEQPIPDHLNFYGINDQYPHYLLDEYDINEKNYNQSDEAGWFKASLKQIRQSGPNKFPPLEWVAIIIVNRAEWHDASTFEQAHKVGAIFKASDVFDSSRDLSELVTAAEIDRHPFKYDTSQPTPGDQQRWLIVEQHAAINRAAVGPK